MPKPMTIDVTTTVTTRGFDDSRLLPANGGGRPVLEVDQVTKIYPSEPPVTALRGSPSPSPRASWSPSSARRGRARPPCCT